MLNYLSLRNLIVALLFLSSADTALAEVQQLYFAQEQKNELSRVDRDGDQLITIDSDITAQSFFTAVDSRDRKLFYMVVGLTSHELRTASLTGQNETVLLSGANSPGGLALDLSHSKVYWTENASPLLVKRANLDGTSEETIITSFGEVDTIGEIQVDPSGGKIYYVYYSSSGVTNIRSANLDGSSDVAVSENIGGAGYISLAIDNTNHNLYWAAGDVGLIVRMSLATLQVNGAFVDVNRRITSIAVDPSDGPRVYFTETANNSISSVKDLSLTVSSISPKSGSFSAPNHLALVLATTLSPNVTLVEPPEVRVTEGSKSVDFVFQPFDQGSLARGLMNNVIPSRAVSLSVRYDLTVKRNSDGLKVRRITKNSKTSVKLPAGTYRASYNARTVSNRSKASKNTELTAANDALKKLNKVKRKTVSVKNKIEDAKARKALAPVQTRKKTNQSPTSDGFSVN